jgi:hypothetical protein
MYYYDKSKPELLNIDTSSFSRMILSLEYVGSLSVLKHVDALGSRSASFDMDTLYQQQ